MTSNMGKTDKAIRILIALVIGLLIYFKVVSGMLATILLVIAGVFVLTSMISFCPLYTLLGLNTCKKER